MRTEQRCELILEIKRRFLSRNGQGQGGDGMAKLGQGGLLVFSNMTIGTIYELADREFGCEQTFLQADKPKASSQQSIDSAA
ncbi:MAG: hypothetical protein ACK5PB_19820 [Pirellula sp.]|jgi:hypothetical protein